MAFLPHRPCIWQSLGRASDPEATDPLAAADTKLVVLVIGCAGRRVSVGESNLCQRTCPSPSFTARFPEFTSSARSAGVELVLVLHATASSASVSTRLPSFSRVSVEPRPSTGWSRFAVQTVVFADESEKQMEKAKALEPSS
ncbi:hypothetical protein C4D60_Mb08t21090 [Musa balbisiana]|uniref:Uncharacterized protein n=1 Tax=Musa balbisiana TaxID=52838 RepID=A0A4S8K5E3_MUSBA|nr:hypothetical protein C4D60_Mb08t21090 [Musa balbisiana]